MAPKPQYRRVRTPEGAAYYGVPVGSLILPNAYKKALKAGVAANKPAPKDALGDVSSPGDPSWWTQPLEGPNTFKVGSESFSAPKGARLFASPDGKVKVVREKNGHITVFSDSGQTNVSPQIAKQLSDLLASEKGLENSAYEAVEFDGTEEDPDAPAPSDVSASGLPVGSTLQDKNGRFGLEKTDSGWEYEGTGVVLSDSAVQEMLDKGLLSPQDSEEGAEATDLPDDLSLMKQGEFMSVADALPVGYSLYAKNGDTLTGAVFSKGEDGQWRLGDSPAALTSQQMWYARANLTKNGPAEPAAEEKAPAVDDKPKKSPLMDSSEDEKEETSFSPGDKITDISYLDAMPPSTRLRITASGQYDTSKGVGVLKTADGWEYDDGYDAPLEELKSDAEKGYLYYDSAPQGSGGTEASTASAPKTAQADEGAVGDISQVGGQDVSKQSLTEAIDGLENHSGFQVAYGLKNLPEGNPFADPEFQAKVKDEAKEAFPDLKPKPAFVAYLKQKAGVETAAPTEKTPEAAGPKVTIGSSSPKNVGVQGYDGGDFTKAEIDEAISLLEGFQGKLFKSHLSKNGNALGSLDPTKIVGFDKDKTVTKQKFLDLLKKKSAGFDTETSEETPGAPTPVSDPETVSLKTVSEDAPGFSKENFASKPTGTEFSFQFGAALRTYRKMGDNHWSRVSPDGGVPVGAAVYYDSDMANYLSPETGVATSGEFKSPEAAASVPETVSAPDAPQEASEFSEENFDLAPAGTRLSVYIKSTNTTRDYQKTEDGVWARLLPNGLLGATRTNSQMAQMVSSEDAENPKWEEPSTPEVPEESTSVPAASQPTSPEEMDALPDGTTMTVTYKGKDSVYTKTGSTWEKNGVPFTSNQMYSLLQDEDFTATFQAPGEATTETEAPSSGDFSAQTFADKPVGTEFTFTTPLGTVREYRKTGPNQWGRLLNGELPSNVVFVDDEDLALYMSADKVSGAFKEVMTPETFNANTASWQDWDALPDGTRVEVDLDTAVETYEKSTGNTGAKWTIVDSPSDYAIGADYTSKNMVAMVKDGAGTMLIPPSEKPSVSPFSEADLTSQPVGTIISFEEDGLPRYYTKTSNEIWYKATQDGQVDSSGAYFGNDELAEYIDDNSLEASYLGIAQPKPDLSKKTFDALPVGAHLSWTDKSGKTMGAVKKDNGFFYTIVPGAGSSGEAYFTSTNMASFADALVDFKIHAEPGDIPNIEGYGKKQAKDTSDPLSAEALSSGTYTAVTIWADEAGTEYSGSAFFNGSSKTWMLTDDSVSPAVNTTVSSEELKKFINGKAVTLYAGEDPFFHPAKSGNVTGTPDDPKGIAPGKYSTGQGGKAHMYVLPNGTGLYVGGNGSVSKMTKEKVKKNFDAGLNKKDGDLPDTLPEVGEGKKKTVKVKTVDKIPDGTYFAGDPNSLKTPVYTIDGDKVTLVKPKTSTEGASNKIGSLASISWAEAASLGAAVDFIGYPHGGVPFTKTSLTNGPEAWTDPDGTPMTPYGYSLAFPTNSWSKARAKVASHGTNAPVEVPVAKVKTLFMTGKFLNQQGDSVIPEGYTGPVTVMGVTTSLTTLSQVNDYLNEQSWVTNAEFKTIQTMGFNLPVANLKAALAEKELEATKENYLQVLKDRIAPFLEGVQVDVPEGSGADAFEFDSMGNPTMPPTVAGLHIGYFSPKSAKTAYIKAASEAHGGVLGQNPTKFDSDEASSWINAYMAGNFAKVYELDAKAAVKPGAKPMLEGWKHPGSAENEDTHKIVWGPAVPGEIPAGTKVPGDWTALHLAAPMAEIHNYLIAAQMQNPTFLSASQQREWVKAHRAGNKGVVDQMSVSALHMKMSGKEPFSSEPLVWTDDIKPAKSYDILFESGPFPSPESWSYQQAGDWYEDNKDTLGDPALESAMAKAKEEIPYGSATSQITMGVRAYFEAKRQEEYEKSLIPVYTKKQIQSVQKGTHAISEWTDQFGNEFFFKPRAEDQKFRADIEGLGNSLGRYLGFNTAKPIIVEDLDGSYGLLQQKVHGVGDLMGADYSTLTAKQVGDIASEHVLDWFLDNDDTKGDNAIITPNGSIVGIDKGRTFVAYGHWQGLTPGAMNTNANTIYSQMVDSIASGKISKETADAAYLQMQKRIKKIQKADFDKIRDMVTEAMKNRTKGYNVPYTIDGKKVPQTLDGLLQAIEHRRSTMDTDFEKLWADTYKKAGYGDLPQPPDKAVEGILSGFDDPELLSEVTRAKSFGKSTLMAGTHIHAGDVQIWNDMSADGEKNLAGRFFVSFRKQDELLSTLKSMSVGESGSGEYDFTANLDKFWSPVLSAAKTVNHHAADQEYNQQTLSAWESTLDSIEADLQAWSPSLPASTVAGVEYVAFPSGNKVPRVHLGQYRLMLEHYQTQSAAIRKGIEDKGKITPHIEQYKSFSVEEKVQYTSPDGHAIRSGNKNWIVTDFSTGEVKTLADDSDEMAAIKSTWAPVQEETPSSGLKVTLMSQTHERTATLKDGMKTFVANGGHPEIGADGKEYRIDLPTGEVIFYRNYGQTGTKRGQSGMLTFRAEGVGDDDSASSTSLERISAALSELGIETEGAQEEDAENIYWREMYDIFVNRTTAGATPAHKAVRKELQQKKTEVLKGADDKYFLEDLSATFDSAADEAAWWRNLYSKHFGEDLIDKVVQDRSYLPKFDHFSLDDAELETGHPYWIRFDVDVEALRQQNRILMSASAKGHDPTDKALSGGNMGAEERFRLIGKWGNGMSATDDQVYGSSHNVYTRIRGIDDTSAFSNAQTFYDPSAMARTRTYSFDTDHYGKLDYRVDHSPTDPLHALKNFHTGSVNETMLPHGASLLDTIEIYAFKDAADRQKVIDALKKRGIEMIRGLPVEDRIVMRSNIKAALQKVRESWKTA